MSKRIIPNKNTYMHDGEDELEHKAALEMTYSRDNLNNTKKKGDFIIRKEGKKNEIYIRKNEIKITFTKGISSLLSIICLIS